MKGRKAKSDLRSDGKPRASAAQITAARRKAAEARWAGNDKAEWRTIRVHADTHAALYEMRMRECLSWDELLAGFATRRA